MKKATEGTIGKAVQLVDFGKAILALKQGKMVCRDGWNGKGLFVFMQVPSKVDSFVIPKMTSLPDSVKLALDERFGNAAIGSDLEIKYSNQLALVKPNNEINGWSPSSADALAEDWIVL